MISPIGKKYLLNPFDVKEYDLESKQQIAVFEWSKVCYKYGLKLANNPQSYEDNDFCQNNYLCRYEDEKYRVLKYLYSYPIAGLRHPATAVKLKHEGAKAGVEDISLDVSSHSWHGLRIEMKAKNGVHSEIQKEWQRFHLEQGFYSVICYSFLDARNEIVKYLQ